MRRFALILLLAVFVTIFAACGGDGVDPADEATADSPVSIEAQVATLIEESCLFHVTEGVGIDDCYVGFERVAVTDCKERDPLDGGGTYSCIAEDLVSGQRAEVRVIDAFDDLGEPDSSATAVNAEDVD